MDNVLELVRKTRRKKKQKEKSKITIEKLEIIEKNIFFKSYRVFKTKYVL